MNDIRGNTPAILNEQSGTLRKPFLVKVVPGKNGNGHIFIIKIGNLYYEMERLQRDGCKFAMHVKNTSGVSETENPTVYWRTESWEILEFREANPHCCAGGFAKTSISVLSVPILQAKLPNCRQRSPSMARMCVQMFPKRRNRTCSR